MASDSPSPSFLARLAALAATPLTLWSSACIIECVAAGTRVATPFGWVLVEVLRPGDAIFAVDVTCGALVATTVTAVRRSKRECLALVSEAGHTLISTPDHPVYAPRLGGFVDAGRAALGQVDRALVVDAPTPEAQAREIALGACRAYAGVHEVFDLTVAGAHPTFVAEGFVVHNKSPGTSATDVTVTAGTETTGTSSTGSSGGTESATGTGGTGSATDSATGSATDSPTSSSTDSATGSTSGSTDSATGSTGSSTGGVTLFPCGDMLQCEVGGEYCEVLHPGVPNTPDSFTCQPMPVDCILDPTCACFEKLMIGQMCSVTPEGGFVIELFAP